MVTADAGAAPGLGVSGSKPPTAAARPSRSGKPPSSGANADPLNVLIATLIKKMREKFQGQADDVRAQEIIAREVHDLMRTSGPIHEGHLSILEERIRSALSGKTPPPLSLSLQRQQVVEKDEWARLAAYNQRVAEEEERQRQERLLREREATRVALARQVAEREARMAAEEEEAKKYFEMEMKDVKAWESEQEARKRERAEAAELLRHQREAQVEETRALRAAIRGMQLEEEKGLLASMAKEYRAERAKEMQRKQDARERLAEVAEQNAVTLRLRADERRRQVEDEIAYMREQEALMDRQQKAREERLAKAREWQARVEARARDLPAGREWLSAEVQERYLKEREEQDRAEDERRKQALAKGREDLRRELDRQLEEKRAAKEAREAEGRAYGKRLEAEAEEAKKERERVREAEKRKQQDLRRELNEQMKANAKLRQVVLMTEDEKRINKDLIARVQEFRNTGRVGAGTRTGVLG